MFDTQLIIAIAIIGFFLAKGIFRVRQWEKAIILRFGKLLGVRDPGLRFMIPVIDERILVDMRVLTFDIPSQDVITRDNISVKVNGVVLFQVFDPVKAVTQVENAILAVNQLAQTTLRSVCGEAELDELLAKRDEINLKIQQIIDQKTEPFGVKVNTVEVKQVDLPQELQRAIAKQAEAERVRRAKIIQAEGEYQAAEKLTEAAKILSAYPASMQLRFLESLQSLASEKTNTIIFPLPIELFRAFSKENSGAN
ncbi:MAG: slipin family protein [Deltaproteobacteria bacterium]|nr:slipin family protein [Deltaproteobacteria bacterium]MCX7953457.1 slipin family protein [Deltaproteobacteria bacterium]